MKKYKIINEVRFVLFLTIIIYISLSSLYFLNSSNLNEEAHIEIGYEEVFIDKGDTVWNIALKYKPEKYDVRDMVAEIKDFNKLEDLAIKPGEILKIPIKKK